VLALAVVCAICIPLWQWSAAGAPAGGDEWSRWNGERIARLLLGPEQIACYCCFVWAGFILLGRYREVRRQRRAFSLDLLPTEDGARIMPDDARLHIRRVDQLSGGKPFILVNMIRLALNKYTATRNTQAVSDTIRTQAEVDLGRMVTSMSTVHYLAWAIPALGFLGTVRGLSGSLGMAGKVGGDMPLAAFIDQVTRHLTVAFDCTLVALVLSITLMFLVHSVQRDEEALVLDCQQYCLEHLALRLYEPEPVQDT
jgi:biopolymer transport protein ExbB/TolQ